MEDRSKSSSTHEQNAPLTFGAIISISSLASLDSFVYIDGFVEDKALAKQFTKNNKPKLIYSKTLFQIYPQSINTNKKRALQRKQELSSEYERNHQNGVVGDPENKKLTKYLNCKIVYSPNSRSISKTSKKPPANLYYLASPSSYCTWLVISSSLTERLKPDWRDRTTRSDWMNTQTNLLPSDS